MDFGDVVCLWIVFLSVFSDDKHTYSMHTTHTQTPLHTAAFNNKPEVIKLLLQFGADVSTKNKYDKVFILMLMIK